MPDRAEGHCPSHAAKFTSARKTDLQIFGGLESDLLAMDQRSWRILIARKLSEEKVPFHRPEKAKNPGKFKGRHPADPRHVYRFGVVAEQQRAATIRRPPKALLAEREVPSANVCGRIGIEQSKLVDPRKWSRWLQRIAVRRGNHLASRKRVRGSGRRVLEFSASVNYESPRLGVPRKTVIAVESFLIRPTA